MKKLNNILDREHFFANNFEVILFIKFLFMIRIMFWYFWTGANAKNIHIYLYVDLPCRVRLIGRTFVTCTSTTVGTCCAGTKSTYCCVYVYLPSLETRLWSSWLAKNLTSCQTTASGDTWHVVHSGFPPRVYIRQRLYRNIDVQKVFYAVVKWPNSELYGVSVCIMHYFVQSATKQLDNVFLIAGCGFL